MRSDETIAVWDELRASLRSDSVALSLPGFGCPRPDGFGATKEEYVDWLVGELELLGEPVDLVGHDWGGFLTARVASLRGDVLRSWASDALGAYDDRYEWHELANVWQTPGAGEAWLQRTLATPLEDRTAAFERLGVPRRAARTVAGWLDRTMGESMLALYRSALDIAAVWSQALESIDPPGLAILPADEPFGNDEFVRVAERARARIIELEGLGHWWMLQDPARGARLLEDFWVSIG